MTENYDIKRERRDLYAPAPGRFHRVDVPALDFLMLDGHGDPNTTAEYAAVVQSLFTLSYAVRAVAKAELGRIHAVGPLEGLWWADDMETFVRRDKGAWDWTMMIVQPPWITPELVDTAAERARAKLEVLPRPRFASFTEGDCVQVLHVGSYDDEGPVLARLHDEHMPAEGLTFRGTHHEIYLSDARKTEPAKLRTILRQPVAPA